MNGTDFYADQSGLGASPTITWSSPVIGTPTLYELTVYQLTASGTSTRRSLVANIYTTGTSVQIPGLLQLGSYVFVLTAMRGIAPGAPFVMSAKTTIVQASSGIITP